MKKVGKLSSAAHGHVRRAIIREISSFVLRTVTVLEWSRAGLCRVSYCDAVAVHGEWIRPEDYELVEVLPSLCVDVCLPDGSSLGAWKGAIDSLIEEHGHNATLLLDAGANNVSASVTR